MGFFTGIFMDPVEMVKGPEPGNYSGYTLC